MAASLAALVRPDDSHDLRLHEATLKVEPEPAAVRWKHDMFDNSICFLEWPEALRTDRLSIVSTLDLTHHPDGQPLPHYSLDPGAEAFPFSYAQSEIPDLARLAERQMPDPDRKVDAWARRIVAAVGTADPMDCSPVRTSSALAQPARPHRRSRSRAASSAAQTTRSACISTCRSTLYRYGKGYPVSTMSRGAACCIACPSATAVLRSKISWISRELMTFFLVFSLFEKQSERQAQAGGTAR